MINIWILPYPTPTMKCVMRPSIIRAAEEVFFIEEIILVIFKKNPNRMTFRCLKI